MARMLGLVASDAVRATEQMEIENGYIVIDEETKEEDLNNELEEFREKFRRRIQNLETVYSST